jgi:hypothetical protein
MGLVLALGNGVGCSFLFFIFYFLFFIFYFFMWEVKIWEMLIDKEDDKFWKDRGSFLGLFSKSSNHA